MFYDLLFSDNFKQNSESLVVSTPTELHTALTVSTTQHATGYKPDLNYKATGATDSTVSPQEEKSDALEWFS